jgi:small nuclear ribonucleoprotein (snRNP)-like protein
VDRQAAQAAETDEESLADYSRHVELLLRSGPKVTFGTLRLTDETINVVDQYIINVRGIFNISIGENVDNATRITFRIL